MNPPQRLGDCRHMRQKSRRRSGSKLLVGSVTKRGSLGPLATAEPYLRFLFQFVGYRGKLRTFVGTIAEGLARGTAAGAPPVFSGFEFQDIGGLLRADGIIHTLTSIDLYAMPRRLDCEDKDDPIGGADAAWAPQRPYSIACRPTETASYRHRASRSEASFGAGTVMVPPRWRGEKPRPIPLPGLVILAGPYMLESSPPFLIYTGLFIRSQTRSGSRRLAAFQRP
jgi:hypothetical protein